MIWEKYAVCKCGWRERVPFGDLFHLHVEVCPRCGIEKFEMEIETARWVHTVVWWNPKTWGTGNWETK